MRFRVIHAFTTYGNQMIVTTHNIREGKDNQNVFIKILKPKILHYLSSSVPDSLYNKKCMKKGCQCCLV